MATTAVAMKMSLAIEDETSPSRSFRLGFQSRNQEVYTTDRGSLGVSVTTIQVEETRLNE